MVYHLKKGDTRPEQPNSEDAMVLFQSKFCPFCQRVALVLRQHGIAHESVYVNLAAKPDWFAEVNPDGKVPVLMMGSQRLVDSLMICRYLEDHPAAPAPLCGNADAEKATVAWQAEFFPQLHDLMMAQGDASSQPPPPEKVQPVLAAMTSFGACLEPKPFICGASAGLADFIAYPVIAIATALAGLLGFAEPAQCDSALTDWLAAMNQLEAVSGAATTVGEWRAFLESTRAGHPDYSV